jgi:hypothetical protein
MSGGHRKPSLQAFPGAADPNHMLLERTTSLRNAS